MPHPLHQQVRQAYHYRCGYCGLTEIAAGGELTVDHYHPRSAGGTDELANLVYACPRCNQYKSDYWPTLQELTAGQFVLHPEQHNWSEHVRENETTGVLESLTVTGEFHLRLLHLNRPQLIAHRLARQAMKITELRLRLLEEQNEQRAQTIQFLEGYIEFLLQLIAAARSSDD